VPQCWGPLDVDERKSRGVNPGGQYDVNNTQVACRAHHQWRTTHPKLAAERGIRVPSWGDL
jgi:protein subunit release factor B